MERNMATAKQVASYFEKIYKEAFGERIDEMKLHKLLYFAQRESYICYDRPLFQDEQFVAGVYGPVLISIRKEYKDDALREMPPSEFESENRDALNYVMQHYATKKSWSLSSISHNEYSWQKARVGLGRFDRSYPLMCEDDIRMDADRMKHRRAFLSRIFNRPVA